MPFKYRRIKPLRIIAPASRLFDQHSDKINLYSTYTLLRCS